MGDWVFFLFLSLVNDLYVDDGHEIVFRAHLRWCVSLLPIKSNRYSGLDDFQALKTMFGATAGAHTDILSNAESLISCSTSAKLPKNDFNNIVALVLK